VPDLPELARPRRGGADRAHRRRRRDADVGVGRRRRDRLQLL